MSRAGKSMPTLGGAFIGLHCAVCLYVRTGVALMAVTIIEGYAVCEDHMGYVAQGSRFHAITSAAKLDVTSSAGNT